MPKTVHNAKIERRKRLRYAQKTMGRPPQPPRSYVTRHMRFRRPLDNALRKAALEERRTFNDLVQLICEDWIALRTGGARLPPTVLARGAPPPSRRRRREASEPPR